MVKNQLGESIRSTLSTSVYICRPVYIHLSTSVCTSVDTGLPMYIHLSTLVDHCLYIYRHGYIAVRPKSTNVVAFQ